MDPIIQDYNINKQVITVCITKSDPPIPILTTSVMAFPLNPTVIELCIKQYKRKTIQQQTLPCSTTNSL